MSFVQEMFGRYTSAVKDDASGKKKKREATPRMETDPLSVFVPRRRYEEVTGEGLGTAARREIHLPAPYNVGFQRILPEFREEFRHPMYRNRQATERGYV